MRLPAVADAARVSLLAGDYDVACMTGTIPHPYSEQMAGEWLTGAIGGEEGIVFMIERDATLVGCTGYRASTPITPSSATGSASLIGATATPLRRCAR